MPQIFDPVLAVLWFLCVVIGIRFMEKTDTYLLKFNPSARTWIRGRSLFPAYLSGPVMILFGLVALSEYYYLKKHPELYRP